MFIFDYIYRGEGGSQKLTQILLYNIYNIYNIYKEKKIVKKMSIFLATPYIGVRV